MSTRIALRLMAAPLALALAGCASMPETTRATGFWSSSATDQLSELAIEFRAQTDEIVFFDFDKDNLDAEARAALDGQADWIARHPDVRFRIAGHTDLVGNLDYNMDLGQRRAEAVLAYFVEKGIDPERLEAMASFGEEAPAIQTEEPERLNRRVTTDVIGFVDVPRPIDGEDQIAALPNSPQIIIFDDGTDGTSGFEPQIGGDTGGIPVDEEPETRTDTVNNDEPETVPDEPTDDGDSDSGNNGNGVGSQANSGRGNGDDGGDPGKSDGKNNGGDEVS